MGDDPLLRAAWLGQMAYGPALELQRSLFERRKAGAVRDSVLLVEHDHVFTLGRRGAPEHVLAPADALLAVGATVHETDRGGETTYHGPGQLVTYPIISIRDAGLGPVAYVRLLEQAMIDTLAEYGVSGHRVVGRTGVFVGGEPGERPADGENPRGRKIGAIGVRVSSGVAMHGFALNVSTDLDYYQHIVPCGMPGMPATSILSEAGQGHEVEDVGRRAASHLATFLQRQVEWVQVGALAA
jgi:lipoyl(octanoyl) transferase